MKSSDASESVPPLLQATALSPVSSREQSVEQDPGSIIVIDILQSESSTSVIVRITSPAPALPFCKLKLVAVP